MAADEVNLYVEDVDKHRESLGSTSLEKRVVAIKEIGFAAWHGTEFVQEYIGSSGALEDIINILRLPVHDEMKKAALQALGIICRNSRANQDTARKAGLVQLLPTFLEHEEESMRKWAAHCMFFLFHGSMANQTIALKNQNLEALLLSTAQDDWSKWATNDAEEVIYMLGFKDVESYAKSRREHE